MASKWYLLSSSHHHCEGYQASMGPLYESILSQCDVPRFELERKIPSPSMKAKRSAAMSKSPRAFTAVILGRAGTVKCFPAGKAYT